MKTTIAMFALGIVATVFWFALNAGLDRSEIAECMQWNRDANTTPGYYVVQWQVDQCHAHGLTINAPVK